MEQAQLKGRVVTAFDVYEENRLFKHEVLDLYRRASGNKMLSCLYCGELIIFKAGKINKPHFAHYHGTYREENHPPAHESPSHQLGKKVLYDYLVEKGYKDYVTIDHYLANKRFGNVVVEKDAQQFVLEFVVNTGQYSKWLQKCDAYKKEDVKAHWIIDQQVALALPYGRDMYNSVLYQMGELDSNGRIFVIDLEHKLITIQKYYEYYQGERLYYRTKFSRSYPLNDLEFSIAEGFITPIFDQEYLEYKQAKDAAVEGHIEERRAETKRQADLKKEKELSLQRKWQKIIPVESVPSIDDSEEASQPPIKPSPTRTFNADRFTKLIKDFSAEKLLLSDLREFADYLTMDSQLFLEKFPKEHNAVKYVNYHCAKTKDPKERESWKRFSDFLRRSLDFPEKMCNDGY